MYHTPNTEGRTDVSSEELDSRDLLTKVHNAPQPMHAELRFQNGHHETTHALAFHIDQQLVVIVKGPTFPSRNKAPSSLAKIILVLFKPFRHTLEHTIDSPLFRVIHTA
jgi:hypothetical protein